MKKIELLILEDMYMDAAMMVRTLENSGIEFNAIHAANKDEFLSAIDAHRFDAILADHVLLGFTAPEALAILKERNIHIPFLLVTGSISDDYALELMRAGMSDYIIKDRLQRLPHALLRCLQMFDLENERTRYINEIIAKESIMLEAARLANFGSWEVNLTNNTNLWSDEQYRILGYSVGDVLPSIDNLVRSIHPDDRETVEQAISNTFRKAQRQSFQARVVLPNDSVRFISGEMVATCDQYGNVTRVNGFIQDITTAKEGELKEKKITADLLQRNKDLEQFAYIISHNLRGPVANIVGLTNVLIDGGLSTEEKDTFISSISSAVGRLDTVITDLNNILQVTRNVNENKEPVNFDTLISEIRSGLGSQLEKKRVTIRCDFGPLNEVTTLKSYMRSVFYNLVSNSVKFRREDTDPVIEITSYNNKKYKGIIFKDNGIGIDTDRYRDYLFGLYKRFHPDRAEGKGMGLYMVKSQVETLGGRIYLESKPGLGTTFNIQFPAEAI